jgi:hypothetical protein
MVIACALTISGCATQQEQMQPVELPIADEGIYKYDAWRPENSSEFEAINSLLHDADESIANNSYVAAEDKIERVLRIKPGYAPAWSRLSWIALQTNNPQRSVLMAKRSNSLAQDDPQLQVLNWSFIRDASMMLNDESGYYDASRKIESLRAF